MNFTKERILYYFVSIFLLILVFLSPDFSQSIIGGIVQLILGIFLTQAYIIPGILNFKYYKKDEDQYFSTLVVLIVSLVTYLFIILTIFLVSNEYAMFDAIVIFFYVLGPSILLLKRHWSTLFITTLWVWFPIEWGLVSDHLGELRFEVLPASSLIGLFSLLWPLIAYKRHLPWFTWKITKEHLKYVNISTIVVTLAVVPLGILMNFLKPNLDEFEGLGAGEAIGLVLLTFIAIFVVQGLMEETLFRGIIFKHWFYYLEGKHIAIQKKFGYLSIGLGSALIASIPFWDSILQGIAKLIPISLFEDMANRVGSLEEPLGQSEGIAIPIFEGYPLWIFYLAVALILGMIGVIVYQKYPQPVVAALIVSSMIFGFAHFEDWRYVMFASFAGAGYGYTYYKTKNIAAAAMVHMGVDAVWSILLTF